MNSNSNSNFHSIARLGLFIAAFVPLLIFAACGNLKPASPRDGGAIDGLGNHGPGGASGTKDASTGDGAATGTGAVVGSAGSSGTGGAVHTGGQTGSAGASGTGGAAGAGAATQSGGRSGGAGSTGIGGTTDGGIPIDAQVSDAQVSIDMNDTTPGVPVNLRTARNYVILSQSGISTVPPSAITGNLGASPVTTTSITGFSLIADSTNVFSTSAQVTGKVYAVDHAAPTPANLTTAIGDMGLAFTDAAGRAPGFTELGAGSIGGMTLAPGVYKWGTGVLVATNVTLNGSATAVWIFQVAQGLTMNSDTTIFLTGGAAPKNVFWQVAGGVVLGTGAHIEGVVLSHTSITLATSASARGRLLAQTAVTLDKSTVVEPAP